MTSPLPSSLPRNGSETPLEYPPPAPTSQLPPVDEVCRILARVLARVQATQQANAVQGDAA